jgi:IS66 C-terminal element
VVSLSEEAHPIGHPQAWLADVLTHLQDHPAKRIAELLPWNWMRQLPQKAAAMCTRAVRPFRWARSAPARRPAAPQCLERHRPNFLS